MNMFDTVAGYLPSCPRCGQPQGHHAADCHKGTESTCEVCGGTAKLMTWKRVINEPGPRLCTGCFSAGLLWAAKQAHAAANPSPPPECVHDWLQNRGGSYCAKCGVQK